ncbi:Methyltransferase domain-containing protein [Asanoa ishikariensis]|uniref:Methyltransferase domain-containing protein n=1 Tax=Asanoa ishikariensis TaxID=137265 RepID=A0A1H3M0X1_9ACTN|nr:class I SAM-dependent methyltransferase [Asanoa ishikariensis]SDY69695.1 Methyltransferase domain-containing protein [Asanoa ishikariensis]
MNVSANYVNDENLRTRQGIWAYGTKAPLVGRVLELVDVAADATVVDVGCGNGRYLGALRDRGHRGPLVGLDLSPGMAATARSASGAATAVADAQTIPIRTGAAQVTLAPHMLYHVPDIPLALAELRRITRPGGRVVVVTNSTRHGYELDTLLADVTGDLLGTPVRMAWDGQRFRTNQADLLLPTVFAEVDKRDLGQLVPVPAAAVVRGYLESLPAEAIAVPAGRRAEVLAEVERRADAHITAHGSFPVTGGATAYLCR